MILKCCLKRPASLSWSCARPPLKNILDDHNKASTHFPQESIKCILLSVFHAYPQLKVASHSKPLGPFNVCWREESTSLRIDAFPTHPASSYSELWDEIMFSTWTRQTSLFYAHSQPQETVLGICGRTPWSFWSVKEKIRDACAWVGPWKRVSSLDYRASARSCTFLSSPFCLRLSSLSSIMSLEEVSRDVQERTFCKWWSLHPLNLLFVWPLMMFVVLL